LMDWVDSKTHPLDTNPMNSWEGQIFRNKVFLLWMLGAMVAPFFPFFIPYVGNLLILFSPSPYLLFGYLLNPVHALVSWGAGLSPAFIYTLKTGHWNLLLVAGQLAITGLLLGIFLRKGVHPIRAIMFTVFLLGIFEGLSFWLASMKKGVPIGDWVEGYIGQQLKEGGRAFISPQDQLQKQAFEAMVNQIKGVLRSIYPSMVVVVTSLLCLLNMWLAHLGGRSFDVGIVRLKDLLTWTPKKEALWVFIASGFGLLFLDGGVKVLSLNLFIVTCGVYFVQGVVVIIWWLEKARAAGWMRILLFAFIGLQQFLLFLVAFLGILDIWVDFRRLRKDNPLKEG